MVYDCRVRKEKCRSILKHVLKRCDNRKSCLRPVVSLSHATKIAPCKGRFTRYDFVACDNGLRQAHDMIYDCCVRQKKCRSILKHVLKRCDNRKSCRRSVVSLSHATKIVPCKSALTRSSPTSSWERNMWRIPKGPLGPIYTVRFCRMRQRLTTGPRHDLRLLCTSEEMS